MRPGRRRKVVGMQGLVVGAEIAADMAVAVEDGLGDKGPVSGYRKGSADPEKETSARWYIRGTEETALLRKALGEKKEEAGRGTETKTEAPQANAAASWFGDAAGKTITTTNCIKRTGLKLRERSGHTEHT
jgi:hypothetical protein